MNGKRVLVTGGSGVIGQELIRILDQSGATIRSLDRVEYPKEASVDIESIQTNLVQDSLDPVREFEPDVIFHLAAVFERTDESASFWNDNWRDNTLLTHRLFDVAAEIDALETLVYASSYLVYDSSAYLSPVVPDQPTIIDEEATIEPRNLCGAAKYYAEQELDFLAESNQGLRVVSPRIFRVYGRGSKDVISRWVRQALEGEEITVYNEENRFDFINARDVAEGLFRVAKANDASGPINLGRGQARSISDVLSVITDEIPEAEGKIKNSGVRDLYESSCADVSTLVETTGWRPTRDLNSGVRDVIKYERQRLES